MDNPHDEFAALDQRIMDAAVQLAPYFGTTREQIAASTPFGMPIAAPLDVQYGQWDAEIEAVVVPRNPTLRTDYVIGTAVGDWLYAIVNPAGYATIKGHLGKYVATVDRKVSVKKQGIPFIGNLKQLEENMDGALEFENLLHHYSGLAISKGFNCPTAEQEFAEVAQLQQSLDAMLGTGKKTLNPMLAFAGQTMIKTKRDIATCKRIAEVLYQKYLPADFTQIVQLPVHEGHARAFDLAEKYL